MNTSDQNQIDRFYTNVRYSEKGRCYFADKILDNGHKINFYARAAKPEDTGLLLRGIEAFGIVANQYDDLVKAICEQLDEKCAEYLDGEKAFKVLGNALNIVGIDVNRADDTRFTFSDSTQTLGGHYVVMDLDHDWNLKLVSISDL